ncbi:MAG: serpin family protein, partial [Clostridiales bacterium]|nr:serpin family protein [Clostridiales bacterium]
MKRVVCALVAVLLLMSAAGAEVSGNPLGLRALEKLTDGTENAAVSPVSLALALSMAREGAAGETLAELDDLLAGEPIDVKALVRAGVRSANAGFVSPDYALLDDYMARVDAKWFEMGGDAMGQVNAWVEDMTDGLIPQILDNPPTDLTALYLVNALAMDEEWRIPFWEGGGYEDAFFAPSGEKSVDYMYV